MTEETAPAERPFAIGRMTPAERKAGRYLRDAEGHPPAAPAEPAAEPVTTAVPVTPDASLMAAAEAPPPAGPVRPEALPDAYWDDATGVKPEAFSKLAEYEAAAAERAAGLPETPDAYSLDLGEDIVGLDGKPLAIDPEDPLAKAIMPALHEAGVPQSAVTKIVRAYAAQEAADAKAVAEAQTAFIAAEQAKLGDAHQKRTAALHGQVIAAIGADKAEHLRAQMQTADAVLALEELVSKIQGPSFGTPPLQTPAMPDLAQRLYGNG